MYKNCNVIMLSTNEKASNIVKILKDTISYTTTENISGGTYQHLYITSNNEIKKDDWFIANQGVHQCIEVVAGDYPYKIANKYNNNEIQYQSKNWLGKKIIATTDTSLISINEQYFGVNKSRKSAVLEQKTLPRPSKQFMQQYIEEYNKGNVITKVEVEYEVDYSIPCNQSVDNCNILRNNSVGCELCVKAYWKPKVNSDNTINIKPINKRRCN